MGVAEIEVEKPQMSVLKEDRDTVISRLDFSDRILLRGTFATPQGSAVRMDCMFYKHSPEMNHTRIFLHLPYTLDAMVKPSDLFPKVGNGSHNVIQCMPDDQLHFDLLKRENIHSFGSYMVHDPEQSPAFRSPFEFFKHFLFSPKGRELADMLILKEDTLEAANSFYKTVIFDRNFVQHPDGLQKELLNRSRNDRVIT